MGTVGRTCTANHEYHTARSEWTRSWSNGRSSSQRFHWKDQSAFQRDARRCLLSGIQLRTHGNTFTLNQQGSFFHTIERWSKSVQMTCERNIDTLEIVCFLKPRNTQSVTSLMLKRELENVRRELRNLKKLQHENTRENVESEMTADERITHERAGHATCDPRCETCIKVRGVSTHPRKGVADAAYFDCTLIQKQSTRC